MCFPQTHSCKTGSDRKDARELSTGQDLFFFTDQKNDPKRVMASHILSPKKEDKYHF